jgi:arylsulfatase A-like enzyme
VLFRRHYSVATPCGPARASLHTGLYAFNHRSVTHGTPLDARHRTFAEIARAAGRDPVLFGYTDTSLDPRTLAADDPRRLTYEGVAPGYRVEVPLPEAAGPWLDHLASRGHGRLSLEEAYGTRLGAPALFKAEDSPTAFLADRFLDWLGRQRPGWFAHLSWIRPHPPWVAPAPWHRAIEPATIPPPRRAPTLAAETALHPWLEAHLRQPWPDALPPGHPAGPWALDEATVALIRGLYLGLAAEVDHHLGRVLRTLAATGALDDTLIVFTADHGEMLGNHWMLGKAGFFPEAFHVPLVIRDPRHREGAGREVGAFTEHVDLMPTLLEALGLAVPLQCDGRSLGPWLQGATPADWRGTAHYEHDFRDVEKLVYERALDLPSDACGLQVELGERFAYVHFSGLPALAFDCVADPGWTRPLADPARSRDLAQSLLSWRMRMGERRLTGAKLTPGGVVGRYDEA